MGEAGKERLVNVSTSIDAAQVTKNLSQTAAGLKIIDTGGVDPLKNMQSFFVDQNSLRDLQSQNTFLMKIILTKETKESFLQFNDVFYFFCLYEMDLAERVCDEHDQHKFKRDHLNDLKPLAVILTTDMVAEWKLVGAGGGIKSTEMFCNLCSCTSSDVHQPNKDHCDRHCSSKDADWHCYHHSMLFHGTSIRSNFWQK
jgi:hypothetical protein